MPQRPRLTPEVAHARRAIREAFALPELSGAKRVLIAISGGPDSMALAAACAFELPKLGIAFSGVVVDHGLQPASNQVAERAIETLKSLGVDAAVVKVKVAATGEGIEAAARNARYRALEKSAKQLGADFTLLGHNLDDQAETVLLGLTRGSGLKSIAGMKVVDGNLVRPFLGISKADLRKSCVDQGIEFWNDPHNLDPKFTRVRIRNLMQELEAQLGPGVAVALSRTAEVAAEADEVIEALALELLQQVVAEGAIDVRKLENKRRAVLRKALLIWLLQQGAKTPSRNQVLAVESLITNWHGQKPVSLSGITVERVAQQLKASKSR